MGVRRMNGCLVTSCRLPLLIGLFYGIAYSAGPVDATSNIYRTGCTGQRILLNCLAHHTIAIKRVYFGVNKNLNCNSDSPRYKNVNADGGKNSRFNVNMSSVDCCKPSHQDCTVDYEKMYPTLNTKCSGYSSCELEVEKMQTRVPCRLKSYTDYMTIVYDCIESGDIATFCTDDVRRGKALYLANRGYPLAIKPQAEASECQCTIRTDHEQGISIHTIDVLLASDGNECNMNLKIQDPMSYNNQIQCAYKGYYGFRSIYSRPVNNVTITLSSRPGDSMAFVWLQAKANDADGMVEILCGQSLQDLLNRIRHQMEARNRENMRTTESETNVTIATESPTTEEVDTGNGTNVSVAASSHSLNSDLAAIVGGIVAAGFILIAMVIIAMALHCRRTRKEKMAKPLDLYPAVNSEPLDLSSYCRYDYDDEHLCSISRSPIKMAAMADEESVATHHVRPNGFTTLARAEEYHTHRDPTPSPPLPAGISTPPPFAQNQPLLAQRSYREVYYPGDLSLRFVKPLVNNSRNTTTVVAEIQHYQPHHHQQGHTTLPANRKAVLISSGPKSPLGKRSKSVTFSQPVAMVTPLNSESEDYMDGKNQANADNEDPSYDNLNKMSAYEYPSETDKQDYPLIIGKPELIKIPRWDKEYREESPVRPMSTFQNSPTSPDDIKPFPAPPPDLKIITDNDDIAYMSDSSSTFWSPTKLNGKPLSMPKPQQAEMYETGV
ncbi:unnamed protein product [Lymnaea stagnalis]|uniref:SUEL-type lectin domain-containing protein n=1 Tax=Lymnaea stagnalis TaxID=6523 RepID=A0AAV2HYZ4_LYMST